MKRGERRRDKGEERREMSEGRSERSKSVNSGPSVMHQGSAQTSLGPICYLIVCKI